MKESIMRETSWSVAGNRHWRDTVTIESVGRVAVSTCRPWVTRGVQSDQYETCLFTARGSVVVPIWITGDDAAAAAHTARIAPEAIAFALINYGPERG
jgi:hypothetical protein